jgi:hypothetical protein
MTQQCIGRNNITISMLDGGSVPIVSQTEIEPMKTALSLMLPAHHDERRSPSRCPCRSRRARAGAARTGTSQAAHSARRRQAPRTPSPSRRTVAPRGDGLRRAPTACEMDARGPSLRARFVFCVEGPQGASLRSGDFALRISFWDYEKFASNDSKMLISAGEA